MARSYASVVRSGLAPAEKPKLPARTEPVVRSRLWRGELYSQNVLLPPEAEAEAEWRIFDWNNGAWLPDGGPAPLVAPPCYYCGSGAEVCRECATDAWWSPRGLQPVVKDGLCAHHSIYHFTKAHAFNGLNLSEFIPQTCASCRAEHPLEERDVLEVKGWSYERMNWEKPLKSPNGGRFNIVFVPIYRYVRVGQTKSSEEQRALWAQAAYDKEMEFSGETKRAEIFKAVILCGDPGVRVGDKMWEAGAE